MKKENEKTTAKDWLKMDLEMQSGAIWTAEKSKLQKEKKIKPYKILDSDPSILKPDPMKYNGKEIPDNPLIIK